MTTTNPSVSMCRHCQHYLAEGRRGGQCQQLGAPVLGRWKACQLAIPPFAPSWEDSLGLPFSGSPLWREQTTHVNPGVIPSHTLETLEACMQSEIIELEAIPSANAMPTPLSVTVSSHRSYSPDSKRHAASECISTLA
jgi:hypothetical protein